ncbi:hypothetical protein [Shewanella sp. GutCb]|uniref:hypothetical protein n=1 Tax=Shewanella sp. GutCb TaxID=2058315 RepID=UPI0015E0E6EC|nr:hypothetical protein [Shewanella sp. GutCb]
MIVAIGGRNDPILVHRIKQVIHKAESDLLPIPFLVFRCQGKTPGDLPNVCPALSHII